MTRARARLGLLLLAVALPQLVGCGGHSSSRNKGSTGGGATAAQVLSVAPASGPAAGGNPVTIVTAGFAAPFQPGVDRVLLGTAPLTSVSLVGTSTLSGIAPAGSGSVDVVVEQGAQRATLAGGYTYTSAPQVLAVTPPAGSAGTAVSIDTSGFQQGFTSATPRVSFGGVPATQVSASGATSLIAIAPAGPLGGAVDVTVSAGSERATAPGAFSYQVTGPDAPVTLSAGPENPGHATVTAPAAGLVLAQVRVNAVVDATLTNLHVVGEGSVDEALGVGELALHHDLDGDGTLDPGEPRLGSTRSFASNGGALDFPLQLDVGPAGPLDLLVVGELRAAAVAGDVLALRIAANGSRAQARGTSSALGVGGGAEGAALQVAGAGAPAQLSVALAPQHPAAPSAAADAADAPVLALRCTNGAGTVSLHGLRLRCTGSGHDERDVLEAKLVVDLDRDGVLDPTDTLISVGRPTGDDGELSFTFLGQRLYAGQSTDLLVTYSLAGTAPAGAVFGLALPAARAVLAHGEGPGGSQVSVPQPLLGALSVSGPAGGLLLRAVGRPARVAAPGSEVEVLALEARAGAQAAASLAQLRLEARGSADDAAEVAGLTVYEDSDRSGSWTPADRRLFGPQRFTANDGTLTAVLPTARQVAAGAAETLLVTVSFTAAAPAGRSFHLRCDPAGSNARGPLAIGTLLVSGTGASALTQPGPGAGKDAHLRGEGLYLNDNFGHSQGLAVGDRPSGQLGERVAYLQLPRPALPAGATPRRAWLALFVAGTGGLVAPSLEVQAFRVVDTPGGRTPWIEGQGGFDAALDGICFDGTIQGRNRPDMTQPDADPAVLDRATLTSASAGQWVLLEVTPAVQAWYAGTSPDHGLRLREANFTNHVDGEVSFWSSEGRYAALRPLLLVEY